MAPVDIVIVALCTTALAAIIVNRVRKGRLAKQNGTCVGCASCPAAQRCQSKPVSE